MTLRWPVVLWALLAIPLAVLAVLAIRHRRVGTAVRFTNLDLLTSVATRRDRWRTALPTALFAGAYALLVLGVARPERTVLVPVTTGTVILVIDTSGSMKATDISPSRLAAAQADAAQLVSHLPPGFHIGVVSFSDRARVVAIPTTDHQVVEEAIGRLSAEGGTALGDGLADAVRQYHLQTILPATAGTQPNGGILLLSDGENTSGTVEPAEAGSLAAASRVPVYTISLGTPEGVLVTPGRDIPVPPHPESLAAIADATGGLAFEAPTASELEQIYLSMSTRFVGYTRRSDEVTWIVALIGLPLLLSAVGLSMASKGRFP